MRQVLLTNIWLATEFSMIIDSREQFQVHLEHSSYKPCMFSHFLSTSLSLSLHNLYTRHMRKLSDRAWARFLQNNLLQSPLPSFLSSTPRIRDVDLRKNNFVRTVIISWACIVLGSRYVLGWFWVVGNYVLNDNDDNDNDDDIDQSCPLPRWCDTPPVGNGMCSPCSKWYAHFCFLLCMQRPMLAGGWQINVMYVFFFSQSNILWLCMLLLHQRRYIPVKCVVYARRLSGDIYVERHCVDSHK